MFRIVASSRASRTSSWVLPVRSSRTIFTTSRRSKLGGTGTPKVPEGSRMPSIYTLILVLGVGLSAYGVYNIYEMSTMWPKAIRGDLRQGIKYRNQGELLLSIHYLRNAWEKTKSLPLDLFKPDSLLKTSGIAIVLAGVLELDGKTEEAYNVYKEALWQLQSAYLDLPPDAPHPEVGTEALKLLTGPERMRAVAIAYKLGSMAPDMGKLDEEEEKWLTWAVTMLLMVMTAPAGSGVEKVASDEELDKAENLSVDLRLPIWTRMHDLAAPFEALGTFYSKQGKRSYALPLYLQATSILIPPPPMKTSVEDQCRGALLMGRIAGILLEADLPGGPPEAFAQALSWAQKGLDVIIATRNSQANKKNHECELAYAALLFNVALIREMSGDGAKARELYEASLKQSKDIGLKSTTEYAREALRNLDSKLRDKSEDNSV